MKDSLSRYTLRISPILLYKLGYIAEFEGRTKNKELEQMVRKRIESLKKRTARSLGKRTKQLSERVFKRPISYGALLWYCGL